MLDVGSGLGFLCHGMANAAGPAGRVVGIEASPVHLEAAREMLCTSAPAVRDRVEYRLGDAASLPLDAAERGSFDVVHARFLLEHVGDPGLVVREMVGAARPGGRIVLADDYHANLRLWPPVEEFDAIWRAYVYSYRQRGTDAFVGRRLVDLLHAAGAAPSRNTLVFFGGSAGSDEFADVTLHMIETLAGARSAVVATGGLSAAKFDAGVLAFARWSELPNAALWYGMCWAEGTRRAAVSVAADGD